MKVIPCNLPVFIDVDDTLVMWGKVDSTHPDAVEFICPPHRHTVAAQQMQMDEHGLPVSPENAEEEVFSVGEWKEYLLPHKEHIAQLMAHKLRGHTIVVWSAGGWQWAEAVVRTLKLEQYVDVVMEKPRWAYDDMPPESYMPKSQYIKLKSE